MTRRMKTEYMRMFTGPRWDTYGSCYRDLVQYRGLRRLLEQAHRPWVWTGWDSGSASGSGASTPPPDQCCSATRLLAPGAQPETAAEPCRAQPQPQPPDRPRTQPEVQPGAHPQPQPLDRPRTQAGAQPEAQAGFGQRSGAARCPAAEFHCSAKEIIVQGNQRDKRHDQAKGDLCGSRRVKSASLEKSLKPSQASPAAVVTKETKAPFAMYGWAEKEVEVGCKKTYNVGASALRGQENNCRCWYKSKVSQNAGVTQQVRQRLWRTWIGDVSQSAGVTQRVRQHLWRGNG
ncbi:centriole, cilia and spindle-associated protein isoform X2 [Rhinoraja longicauda]